MKCREIEFKKVDELDGSLVYMESLKEIPFEIKRIFYIFNTPEDATRANHANKSTDFALICVHGYCKVSVDDGHEQMNVSLNSPNKGLYIPQLTWMKTYDFSTDCVLLVLANSPYEKNQYYENYEEFKLIAREQKGVR
ncbi:sugar 3,4-ketoisomerase [Pelosinus sp. sgz500959]|uniref:sugar 3,4-ketoisomerase n=1 Tax=Pelosinus sp. sgz500959 TaxID=3242472 RepID=UPI00366CECBD